VPGRAPGDMPGLVGISAADRSTLAVLACEAARPARETRVENKKAAVLVGQRLFLEAGGESGTRTPDLRIMIPSL
jgi:hypothetical protein